MSRRAPAIVTIALIVASTLVLAPTSRVERVAATAGPIARWTFDDGSGTTANDSIGNLDGTLSGGPTWITGDVAQGTGALSFDGVDDLVTVANNAILEPSGVFTVAFWMKAEYDTSFASVVAKGHFDCGYGGSWGVVKGNTGPSGYARMATTGYWMPTSGSGPGFTWWDDTWRLLTYTVDPGAGTGTLTMDGHEWTSEWLDPDSVDYAGPDLIDSALRFGGIDDACLDQFKGELDDIRIWDRALSHSEVLAMLPSFPTTTDLWLCTECVDEETSITSAFVDEEVLYRVHVSPWPASPGDITWYRSKDGGPEAVFATTPLRIEDMTGYQFYFQEPEELTPGSYTIRASWPGADNWGASSSAALPLEIVRRPVEMESWLTPAAVLPGESATLTARLEVTDPPETYGITGAVEVYETTGDDEELVGSGNLAYTGNPHWNTATINIPTISAGAHTYEARFAGTSTLAGATVEVSVTAGPQTSWVDLSFNPNPVLHTQNGNAVVVLGTYRNEGDPTGGLPSPTGTLQLRTYPGGTLVASTAVTGNGEHELPLPLYAAGTRQFTVSYSGDSNFASATSEPETLTIQTDVVEVHGVGVEYATFYPYQDGYRDTVAIQGTRDELASVAISIYNPDGKRIRTAAIDLNSGPWSWTWNGRKTSGEMYAAGKYKVVQVITDEAGITKSVTSYVTLSHKRLVTRTATITKDHTQVAKKTQTWLAWNFRLPSAAVYTKLTVAIYGRDNFGGGGFGPQDYTQCSSSTMHPDCATRWRTFPTTFKWKSFTANVNEDRSGRNVRLYAWGGFGDTRISRGRVTVVYQILR